MGVQGLTTFVEGNRNFLQDLRFRDSRLVIDGCSLYYRLYFHHGLDRQHGGDYDAFACLLTRFLSALAACKIQPYVVLDGGIDPSDKKFSTLRSRLQSKIREADSLSHGRNGSVLPILTRQVFIHVLTQRGAPLVQCSAEADWEIACLARQWNCPVLTNDSDFYVFDLPGGYLPLQYFQWTNLNGKACQRYISSRFYTTNNLCRWFGGLNRELLHLCAVINGNDYGAPMEAETLLDLIDVGASGRGGGRGKGRASSSRIESLLIWLSSFSSVAEALKEVSRLMCEGGGKKKGQKDELSSQLRAAMQEYNIKAGSSLVHWFSEGKVAPRGNTCGPTQLPDCLFFAAAQGQLAPAVVDAWVMQRVLLIPQVENNKLASSHLSSKAIRQAIYGILLQGQDGTVHGREGGARLAAERGRGSGGRGRGGRGQVHTSAWSKGQAASVQAQGTPICVEEYDRLDLSLKKNLVEAQPPRTPVLLSELSQAPVALRLGVLFEVLAVKESALEPVPPHQRLVVAVTGFWLREVTPTPPQPLVQALVLSMVYGEVSFNNQPGNSHQHAVPRMNWAAERQVLSVLGGKRVRPGERQRLDLGAAHSLSQWQACFWSALCLNQLLLMPLPQPQLSWVFSGTLVHGLYRALKAGWAVETLLPVGSVSGRLYSCLLEAVWDCSFKPNPSSLTSGRKRRGRGRGKRRGGRRVAQSGRRDADELNNRFALLMSDEEFDH
uniref:Asteroid homolog 1 n=2 Tax=Nothobranchius korthausae TaxID=1143690 RepID=A0A1A8FM83_9TELE